MQLYMLYFPISKISALPFELQRKKLRHREFLHRCHSPASAGHCCRDIVGTEEPSKTLHSTPERGFALKVQPSLVNKTRGKPYAKRMTFLPGDLNGKRCVGKSVTLAPIILHP